MKKPIVTITAIVLALIVAAFVFLRPSEPSFEDRGINAWLDDFVSLSGMNQVGGSSGPQSNTAAEDAKLLGVVDSIQRIGTNGIPFIFQRVREGESGWRKSYAGLRLKLPNWLQRIIPPPRASLHPIRAASLMEGFSTRALPFCIEAMKDNNLSVRQAGVQVVSYLAQNRYRVLDALPTLVVAIRSTNLPERVFAVEALGRIGPEAASAVPALAAALQRNDPGITSGQRSYEQSVTVIALKRIGPAAKPAVPAIKPFLQAPLASVREEAALALWRIDGDVENTLPILTALLTNRNPFTPPPWIDVLAEMGPRASNAFPVLVNELALTPLDKREKITNALFKIDPEKAAKVVK